MPGNTSHRVSGSTLEHEWFANCPKGLESLLQDELVELGGGDVRQTVAGVYFRGPLALGYRACLWSRLANRVLLPLATLDTDDADSLYRQLRQLDWGRWFTATSTISVDFSGRSDTIRNTRYGAQRCKDAIVDWFVDAEGRRPGVDRANPDIRLNVRLAGGKARLAIDFSGGSLHRRAYRLRAGEAPLKENLAAAILLRAGWPAIAGDGGALIDPMCGSGTLLLEGAMMALDIAPGLRRERFGFERWSGHDDAQWRAICSDAQGRARRGLADSALEIRGYDADPGIVRVAQQNAAALDLENLVRIACKPLNKLKKPTHKPLPKGLLVCNPPFGERLGDKSALSYLYRELGAVMADEFSGWQAALFTGDAELGHATGLRSHKQYAFWNGGLPATLVLFDLARVERLRSASGADRATREPASDARGEAGAVAAPETPVDTAAAGPTMFANRLRKNQRRLKNWLKQHAVSAYRLYDADLPEYAVAVDIYGQHAHVAEYRAPDSVPAAVAAARLDDVKAVLPGVLGLAPEAISYKRRQRQRGSDQYRKQAAQGDLISVTEGQARLLVNLKDYLDTGLFLDHRPLRRRIAAEAAGVDFLNLFCYTGSATVQAALGGARKTTSVDLSKTYLAWLRKNLAHNGLGEATNRVVRQDCLKWLEEADGAAFDLILVDPPSFSNSSAFTGTFDVLRDHPALLRAAMRCLRPGGTLYFSCNRRGFRLAPDLAAEFDTSDITASTLDPDFRRNPRIHVCWQFRFP